MIIFVLLTKNKNMNRHFSYEKVSVEWNFLGVALRVFYTLGSEVFQLSLQYI